MPQDAAITIHMRQPEFETSPEHKAEALQMAFRDARTKAIGLAAALGGKVGKVVSFEEGRWARRSSGFSGDEDWWGDSERFGGGGAVFMAAGEAAETASPVLEDPTREIFVKCRVRFELSYE